MEYTVNLLQYITVGVRHTTQVVGTYGKRIGDQDKQVQRTTTFPRRISKDTTINRIAYAHYVLNTASFRVWHIFTCTGDTA